LNRVERPPGPPQYQQDPDPSRQQVRHLPAPEPAAQVIEFRKELPADVPIVKRGWANLMLTIGVVKPS
jgi:hypothetical protein